MKLDPKSAFTPGLAHNVRADPILAFVSARHEALWNAARLLGGSHSARLVDRCVQALRDDRCVTRRTRIMLGQILSVLSLKHVDNPDLPYMGYLAAIDSGDPVVDDICLLTDELRGALEHADIDHPQAPHLRSVA